MMDNIYEENTSLNLVLLNEFVVLKTIHVHINEYCMYIY